MLKKQKFVIKSDNIVYNIDSIRLTRFIIVMQETQFRLSDIFQSAIDRCLQFGGKHSHHWLGKLVEQVTERYDMWYYVIIAVCKHLN